MTIKNENGKIDYKPSNFILDKTSQDNQKFFALTIKAPKDLLRFYDSLVEEGYFTSRSEAIRYGLRIYKDFFHPKEDKI